MILKTYKQISNPISADIGQKEPMASESHCFFPEQIVWQECGPGKIIFLPNSHVQLATVSCENWYGSFQGRDIFPCSEKFLVFLPSNFKLPGLLCGWRWLSKATENFSFVVVSLFFPNGNREMAQWLRVLTRFFQLIHGSVRSIAYWGLHLFGGLVGWVRDVPHGFVGVFGPLVPAGGAFLEGWGYFKRWRHIEDHCEPILGFYSPASYFLKWILCD